MILYFILPWILYYFSFAVAKETLLCNIWKVTIPHQPGTGMELSLNVYVLLTKSVLYYKCTVEF